MDDQFAVDNQQVSVARRLGNAGAVAVTAGVVLGLLGIPVALIANTAIHAGLDWFATALAASANRLEVSVWEAGVIR